MPVFVNFFLSKTVARGQHHLHWTITIAQFFLRAL